MIRYSKERHNILINLRFGKMTLVIFINEKYILDPKKYALSHTITEPIHMMTKMEVIIVCCDYDVLKASVVDNNRHNTNGPHKSPTINK